MFVINREIGLCNHRRRRRRFRIDS